MGNKSDAGREQPSLAVPPLDDTRRQRLEVKLGAAVLAVGVITLVLIRVLAG